jgi:CubicO group peptidase (beta-lactamase class C family)
MQTNKLLSLLAVLLITTGLYAQKPVLQAATPSSAGFSEERLIRIDQMLQQNIDKGNICGAIGFIARDGKIVCNKTIGFDDPAHKKPLDRKSVV